MKKIKPPVVTMSFMEYLALSVKAAKWDRIQKAFEAEGKTA
jgi:hypothetical protein